MNRIRSAALSLVACLSLACTACQSASPQAANPGNLPEPLSTKDAPDLNATTFFAHANLLERQGNFERAVVQYKLALGKNPNFVLAHNRLGITYNKLGRHDDAADQFRQAVALQPQAAHLYNNLGFALFLANRFSEAEEALRRATAMQPQFARAHLNLGLTLARQQRFDEAYAELCQVGSEADANYNMGLVLLDAQLYADAASYFEAALKANPKLEAARTQLREVARLAAGLPATPEQAPRFLSAHEGTPLAPSTPPATLTGAPALPTGGVEDDPTLSANIAPRVPQTLDSSQATTLGGVTISQPTPAATTTGHSAGVAEFAFDAATAVDALEWLTAEERAEVECGELDILEALRLIEERMIAQAG